jgi:ABC transport system ATP-binding/permease protein
MNLLSVSGLSKSFGDRVLFRNISFGISRGDKVALVADNGSGKTTLFRIIKGTEIPDEGEVVFRRDLRVAFLDQDFTLSENLSVREIVANADNPAVKASREYELAIKEAESSASPASASRLESALHTMTELGAWDYEKRVNEILTRLGIRDLDMPTGQLSGGQRKRVALALCLIDAPELLIMDEPTNHLDIDMIEWLEDYLSDADLSVLLVTHDRYFLDNVCDRVLEIDQSQMFEYRGDFENFLEKKASRIMSQESETAKAKNLYRRELEWMRKMPKARGTKARARVNAFGDLQERASRRVSTTKIQLDVKMERLGSKIVELHKVNKAFDGRQLIKNFSYTFVTGEKVGLVGKNGSGKSTLIKMILGLEQPDSGKVQRGDTVVFGYYSQSGMDISDDKRIIEVVKDIAEFIPLANGASLSASQLLNRFNFSPARQYTRVSKLSGGEKRRLYLLTVLARNPNFLILDEPSNDLDLLTLQTLEEFLDDFKGCVLIASHDRFLLDRLADHTFALESGGEVKDFPGGYSEYRSWKSAQPKPESSPVIQPEAPAAVSGEQTQEEKNRKLSFKVQRELEMLEKEIPQLEERKMRLTEQLSEGMTDYNEIQRISDELAEVDAALEGKSTRWLEIQEGIGD